MADLSLSPESTGGNPSLSLMSADIAWGAAYQQWRIAKRRHMLDWDAYRAMPYSDSEADIASEMSTMSGDALAAAESALMELPAPNLAALRWKLDHILEPDSGSDETPGWSMGYVRQTIADYRRLLGEG